MKQPLLLAAALAVALPAAAQFRKPEDAIKHRRSAMALQGYYAGPIFAMANGRRDFDPKLVAQHAEILATLAKLPWVGFVDGTDRGETNAKPEIWKERAKFDAGAKKLQQDVADLNVAAKTGDLAKIKAAVGTMGQTCKSCHDNFRKEM